MPDQYQLFAWNYSYFSAKVRAYMRYKRFTAGLPFEEILASSEIIRDLLIPSTGSNVVPQVRTPDGQWIQDSSEIIDVLEGSFTSPAVIPSDPKQKLACYLIELLADEWMLPWGFWERWHYSLPGVEPNHEKFNAAQWGRMFFAEGSGQERIERARFVFREVMKIEAPDTAEWGPYAGLVQLGITDETIGAWTESIHHILSILESHFDQHDYVFGGVPTLTDFALIGPLYPHLYKDPVTGFMMRTQYPLLCEWIERTNGSEEAGYRSYAEPRYRYENGELAAEPAGELLANDEIPETVTPLIDVFFTEMLPMLLTSIEKLSAYITSECEAGKELPGKSFYSPVQFKDLQSGEGPLTVTSQLRGVDVHRMASPYQVWMLHRLHDAVWPEHLKAEEQTELTQWLSHFAGGEQLQSLKDQLASCPIEKRFEQLFAGVAKP